MPVADGSQTAGVDDELNDFLYPGFFPQIREDEGPVAAHPPGVPVHDLEQEILRIFVNDYVGHHTSGHVKLVRSQ